MIVLCCNLISDGVESDLPLVHPDNVDWIITLDEETHHELMMQSNKGRSMTICYVIASCARSGEEMFDLICKYTILKPWKFDAKKMLSVESILQVQFQ